MLVVYYPVGKSIYNGVEHDNKVIAKDMLILNIERAKHVITELKCEDNTKRYWRVEEVPQQVGEHEVIGQLVEIYFTKKPREWWIIRNKKGTEQCQHYTENPCNPFHEDFEVVHVREVIE